MSVSVFGSLNLDIALRLPSRPAWGQTLLAEASEQAAGGKGLNQAVAAARFGAGTRMAGAVGADPAGMMLRAALEAEGVDTAHIEVLESHGSGRATILLDPAGHNLIVVEPGANLAARADRVIEAIDEETRVLLAQLETDVDQIAALFASPAAAPLCKMLNAAPAIPAGSKLFDLTDILIFNQSEFAHYLQLDREPETAEDLVVARRLLTRPGQAVVVTLGAIGSAAVWADRGVFAPAIPAEAVVDTSGAGDCFCGVLAACIDKDIELEEALRLANAAASLSVGRSGAAPSMPVRADIDALVEA
jgi:ribokinase